MNQASIPDFPSEEPIKMTLVRGGKDVYFKEQKEFTSFSEACSWIAKRMEACEDKRRSFWRINWSIGVKGDGRGGRINMGGTPNQVNKFLSKLLGIKEGKKDDKKEPRCSECGDWDGGNESDCGLPLCDNCAEAHGKENCSDCAESAKEAGK